MRINILHGVMKLLLLCFVVCARYTESVLGKVTVEDDKECDKIPYDITFAPVYPYHSLSNKTDTFQVNSPKTRVKEVQRQQTLPS